MPISIYQVDAFTDKIFSGNPAAICPLEQWPESSYLQNIAMENNLAETGFYVKKGDQYEIRWFTPTVEVDLCGHATLGAAHVIFNHQHFLGNEIRFHSHRSGPLRVLRNGQRLTLDFPADPPLPVTPDAELLNAFTVRPVEILKGKTDIMFVFENEEQIKSLNPEMKSVAKLPYRGVIVTSRGDHSDFVSRFFAPQSGIDEDPVTGSAHTTLTPFWSGRINKPELTAIQLSKRKGFLACKLNHDRVLISGQARTFMVGEIMTS